MPVTGAERDSRVRLHIGGPGAGRPTRRHPSARSSSAGSVATRCLRLRRPHPRGCQGAGAARGQVVYRLRSGPPGGCSRAMHAVRESTAACAALQRRSASPYAGALASAFEALSPPSRRRLHANRRLHHLTVMSRLAANAAETNVQPSAERPVFDFVSGPDGVLRNPQKASRMSNDQRDIRPRSIHPEATETAYRGTPKPSDLRALPIRRPAATAEAICSEPARHASARTPCCAGPGRLLSGGISSSMASPAWPRHSPSRPRRRARARSAHHFTRTSCRLTRVTRSPR